MKAFLIALIFTGFTMAQSNGQAIGDATIWTDSLGYSGSDTLVVADSSFILKVDFNNEWYKVFVKGNANSSVDSIYVQAGAVRYNNYGTPLDTVWGSYTTLKDSAWNSVNVIVNNTVGKDYMIYTPVAELLKFQLLNYRAALTTRNVVLTIQALRKR
jgi:hypothetical protein